MIPIVVGLMAVFAAAAVVLPFVLGESGRNADDAGSRLEELLEMKDVIYGALKELDFDRAAGKLSDPDFRRLEAQYRERAIGVLRGIDALVETGDPEADLSEALEREILALRKAVREEDPSPGAAETAPDARGDPPEPRFCRDCGVPVSSTDNFCSSCGTVLRETS
ncbi:MAG: zinc-ribbon domain-containing protein [Nitrospinota bacterium]|nr:zinc-ribbon domain-containing protein [Nitrospinota bacterium]HJM41955.1 zinc-ribbon domain-containing protein [Nitrospinota bacterium]